MERQTPSWSIGGLNTSRTVQVPAAGKIFMLEQAYDNGLCGTALWDSAVAFVRHLDHEAESGSGSLCGDRLRAARVIELGAGIGLVGMAFAAHGAEVTLTDKPEVMAHMRKNVMANADQCGSEVQLVPFCWGTDPHASGLSPPYHFVVATDVIYLAAQIAPLIDSLLALSDARSTVVVAVERRDEAIWEAMLRALKAAFKVRRVGLRRMQQRIEVDDGEDEAGADGLGIFVAHKRNRPPPPREEGAAQRALDEPPGSRLSTSDL